MTGAWIVFFVGVIFGFTNYHKLTTLIPHPPTIVLVRKLWSLETSPGNQSGALVGTPPPTGGSGEQSPSSSLSLFSSRGTEGSTCLLSTVGWGPRSPRGHSCHCWHLGPCTAPLWLLDLLLFERAHMVVPGKPPLPCKCNACKQFPYFDVSWLVTLTSSSKSIVPGAWRTNKTWTPVRLSPHQQSGCFALPFLCSLEYHCFLSFIFA